MSHARLRAVLLAHPAVRDCEVLHRSGPVPGRPVAYVVAEGNTVSPDRLDVHVRSVAPDLEPPDAYVSVRALPLDADGKPDRRALESLPVVDEATIAAFRSRLMGVSGIREVVMAPDDDGPFRTHIHLSTLIPGWSRSRQAGTAPAVDDQGPPPTQDGPPETEGGPAWTTGGELAVPLGSPATLGAALHRAAAQQPDSGIGYLGPDGEVRLETYAELRARAERIGGGLRDLSVEAGSPAILQLPDNPDFLGGFWGCVATGLVPVPVAVPPAQSDHAAAVEKLVKAWRLLERPLVVATRGAAARLEGIARRRRLEGFRVACVEDLVDSEPLADWHTTDPADVALMMLTSGTTGTPKAVTLSHRNLLGRAEGTRQRNALGPRDVTLNWMPFDHVAGLTYFHLRDVYLGCLQLHGPTELVLQRPTRWLDWLDRHRATVTFAPNFAYALVNDEVAAVEKGSWDLTCVRQFHNGGEAIVAQTARRFLEILAPHGLAVDAVLPAWGMSETSSAVTFRKAFTRRSTSDDDPFVEVGAPIPGIEIRIVDGEGRTVGEGAVGRVEVRGVSVTPGYYRNAEATADAFGPDGWFRTGDLGLLRAGQLTITGRVKDVIIVNGINYYSHEIERVVDGIEGVSATWSAACAVRPPGTDTDLLAIFFHTEATRGRALAELLVEIRQAVVRRVGIRPRYVIPVAKEQIPRTGIGKIQRPLLRQRFDAGELEDPLREVECLVGGPETLPPWFFKPTWVRREVDGAAPSAGDCVVLDAGGEAGEALRSHLEGSGRGVVAVRPGTAFERLGEWDFRMDPGDPAHFEEVLRQASSGGLDVRTVVNLWPYEADRRGAEPGGVDGFDEAQRLGAHAVLLLVQALSRVRDQDQSVRLLNVTRRALAAPGRGPRLPDHAGLAALGRTASSELPWLQAGTLDLEGDDATRDAGILIREVDSAVPDPEAASAGGRRWVRRLERVQEEKLGRVPMPFRRGGLYLLTGGMGGIGIRIARYFLSELEARVVLVGRRDLSTTSGSDSSSGVRERVEALEELRGLGDVVYASADVGDLEGLERVVATAEDRCGTPLDGVVHLAGTFENCQLLDDNPLSFGRAGRAKTVGTENVCALVRSRPGAKLVAFSSVNAFFGGYGAGAYAAANAYMESVIENLASADGVDGRCFAWSLWEEVGMSRGYDMKHATARRGYHLVQESMGVRSFIGALHTGEPHLLIGIDGDHRGMAPAVTPADVSGTGLVAHVAAANPEPLGPIATQDRFGNEIRCRIQHVGAPGLERAGHDRSDEADTHAAAPTALQSLLAEAWRRVLRLDAVGLDENFFDLGADSVTMVRALAEIQPAVAGDLTLTTLYEHPTVRRLAGHLAEGGGGETGAALAASERRGAVRRERMQRRRRNADLGEVTGTPDG